MPVNSILLEAFGAPTDENTYNDDTTREDIAEAVLHELHETFGIGTVETIVTGMNAQFTYALQDVTEDHPVFGGIDIEPFYPNITRRMEEDDLDYQDAWKEGYNWRNSRCLIPDEDDDDQTVVDLVVRAGDAGNNGEELLRQARRAGTPAFDINLDDNVDKDAAYGASETDSSENAELDEFEDDSPAVSEINGIGDTYSERLAANGIETAADLSAEDPEAIGNSVKGVSADRAADWVKAAEAAA